MSIHVEGPFGGCDEQAETEAFEDLMGGPTKAFRMLHMYQNTYPAPGIYPGTGKSKDEIFRAKAKREGFTDEQIEAFFHLQ